MKALWIAALCLAAVLPARADEPGGLSGYVRDDHGRPMADVEVGFSRAGGPTMKIRTDKHGFFSDITLEPGRYLVSAEVLFGLGSWSCVVRDVQGGEFIRVTIVAVRHVRDCAPIGASLVDSNETADVYRI
jgi:hypothetical protein